MNAKTPNQKNSSCVLFGGVLAGSLVGLLWGSGLLDLVSRHHARFKPLLARDDRLTVTFRILSGFPIYGALAGAAMGSFFGDLGPCLIPQKIRPPKKRRSAQPVARANGPERP